SVSDGRPEIFGFRADGAGLLHRLGDSTGIRFRNLHGTIAAKSDFIEVSREVGDGRKTRWSIPLKYPPFFESFRNSIQEFDLAIRASASAGSTLKLTPQLPALDAPLNTHFALIGDGNGELRMHSQSGGASIDVEFSKAVARDAIVQIEYRTAHDMAIFNEEAGRSSEAFYNWFNQKSVYIRLWFLKFAGAYDNVQSNTYYFSPDANLDLISEARRPVTPYYLVNWDCDTSFNSGYSIDDMARIFSPGFSDGEFLPNDKASQVEYVRTLYDELKDGGVMSESYVNSRLDAFLGEAGNGIALDEVRWRRPLRVESLRKDILERLANKEQLRYGVLSLHSGKFVPP
ncbi:MAG: hypothetical protein KDD60_08440, partial [Bdellovibrionales bacterium]|nr:hypothetical protein [Bdellovibrionales bacterium]